MTETDTSAEAARIAMQPSFKSLWDFTHGPGAWERNDWVLATTFRVDLCNIDQMEEAT